MRAMLRQKRRRETANILDTLTKGEKDASDVEASDVEAKLRVPAAGIDDVRNAVYDFLKKMDFREVSVVKLVSVDPEKGTWEAEAEVYTPNKAIRALGLPVQREVLDCRDYLLRVDGQLKIIAYGPKDSVKEA